MTMRLLFKRQLGMILKPNFYLLPLWVMTTSKSLDMLPCTGKRAQNILLIISLLMKGQSLESSTFMPFYIVSSFILLDMGRICYDLPN